MRWSIFILFAVLCLAGCAHREPTMNRLRIGNAASELARTAEWYNRVTAIRLGSSENDVRSAMEAFTERKWKPLSDLYRRRLDFLAGQRILVWVVDQSTVQTEGGETYVLATFSPENGLTDLLTFRPALHLRPLVRSIYAERLESIRKGMSVDDIYRLLGEELPYRYYRDDTGRWMIHFSYQGVGPDFWIYEADAATGTIVDTGVSSI